MPATLTIQTAAAYANGTGGTDTLGPFNAIGTITPVRSSLTLASGNNSFTVPTGSVGCVIVPPTTNTIALKAKTTSGDTGINIPPSAPSVQLFDPANLPATLFLNAASLTTGLTIVIFF